MRNRTVLDLLRCGAALVVLGAAAACAPAAPPDPGTAPAPAPPRAEGTGAHVQAADAPRPTADARFLQHMIPHHAQALVMTAMVPGRTQRPDIRLVAERIAVSQRDEIAQMQAWLRARGEMIPTVDTAAAGHDHAAGASPAPAGMQPTMPGMLTGAELAGLAASRGPAFDRIFLELMIRHHEGAITMVRDLFSAGGGQDSQVYAIASEVDSDQRMEIARMQAILAGMPSAGRDHE